MYAGPMEHVKLWKLVANAKGKYAAEPVTSKAQTETEKFLEDVLTNSPDLLMEGLKVIGRQNATEGGPLDLLGVDEEGRLVVFELKRGTLNRDAISQAVDYASFLSELSEEKLGSFISAHSGLNGVEKIEDFGKWYASNFPQTASSIGKPRIVLVGIGVDDATKRMVSFLSESGVDISVLTFHAFVDGGQMYLAKQVETRSVVSPGISNSKAGNLAELHLTLKKMNMKDEFESLANAIKDAFGIPSYQWPYKTGYAFSRPGTLPGGGTGACNYLTLFVDSLHPKQVRLYFHSRGVKSAGLEKLQAIALSLSSKAVPTPMGHVGFWIDIFRPNQAKHLTELVRAMVDGSQAADYAQEADGIEDSELAAT
jgi:hypothetical protein